VAGSFRRARETVGDLDVLVTTEAPETVFDVFSRLPEVREVRLRGPTKETVVLDRGTQVDLRVVEPAAFGAALQYFTGSKDHNVRLRSLARERGLKVNEYGVYRGDERVAGRTEEEVYAALGLAWIPPELREDRGEIDLAARGALPRLVERADLRSELHGHLSEGADERELDRAIASARARSLRALAVVVAAWGLGARRWEAVEGVRERVAAGTDGDVALLTAVEVDPACLAEAHGRLAELRPQVAIVVPSGPPPRTAPAELAGIPVRMVAHVGGSGEAAAPAVEWARRVGAAVEVGPGAGRLDSSSARRARDSGVPLGLPTGAGDPPDDPTAPVALAFARRAGAVAADVANARDPTAPAAPAGATAPGRPRARPRR
jgi:DNA polymerase (family X)